MGESVTSLSFVVGSNVGGTASRIGGCDGARVGESADSSVSLVGSIEGGADASFVGLSVV